MVKPYKEYINDEVRIREFSETVSEEELIWHRDKKNRLVEVLEVNDWEFQRDNELPIKLSAGDKFFIPALQYHRVIKNSGSLRLKIQE